MPDIAMCFGVGCKDREQCYRFKAEPNPYRQSYADFKPKEGEGRCDDFVPAIAKSQMKRLDAMTREE